MVPKHFLRGARVRVRDRNLPGRERISITPAAFYVRFGLTPSVLGGEIQGTSESAVLSAVSARPLRAPCVEMKYCGTERPSWKFACEPPRTNLGTWR